MENYPQCGACDLKKWKTYWTGSIRDGAYGRLTETTNIVKCENCGVLRLDEEICKDESFYQSTDYRNLLKETSTTEGFFLEHDPLQMERLRIISPHLLRSKNIADVGCAAGSFLDHVKGLINSGVAIEPASQYHESLRNRGYHVYPNLKDAADLQSGSLDYVCSFSVIEHVAEPLQFIRDMARLLAKNGKIVISTPNRNDILMHLLPDIYSNFFYRTVHRWYFDRESLGYCAMKAGLKIESLQCVHRFGLGNALLWLREHKPPGRTDLPVTADEGLNAAWATYLERNFLGDYLYMVLSKPD